MSGFSLHAGTAPTVGIELAAHRVSAVAVSSHRTRPAVTAHAMESLPAGALVPSLTAPNIRDRGPVVEALARVLERVGGAKRVGLIVPDPIAKVSLLRFQQVPGRAEDLDRLIRWQVRKAAPFPIEDAQVTFGPGARWSDGQEFVVAIARRDVVAEYEGVCAAAGAHAGLVDLSTFNVANAVLAGSDASPSDWLLVNVAPDWVSMAIFRGGDLITFRSRSAEGDGAIADLVHQTAMYYEDRLSGSGFSRVLFCGATAGGGRASIEVEQLRRSLAERLGTPVEAVDPRTAVVLNDRIVGTLMLLDTVAPLVGLLVRDRKTAA
jgi:Tfp pilus assembly PilM family ATPase